MFQELEKESFNEREERILNFWERHRVFLRSIEKHSYNPHFTFYDGPPFATGLPHYGHLLAGTIKDVVPRYKTMKGYCVERRFGWDCHGLPVENEIEKAHNLQGAASIEEFGIGKFNEECRKIVLRYSEEWKEVVNRMGRWVDFDRTYRTMDLPFMESVWWVFKQLYEKGLVYEGYKVMPFSAKLGTPLSNFEAGENYKDVDDPSLTVSLPLVDDHDTALLVWTTTPWTLISNLAVMAGPEIDYVKVKDHDSSKNFILAEARLGEYYKNADDYQILDRFKGSALAGKRYKPLFDYFADRADAGAFRVILEEGVATDEGTGLVHSAPAFGEVDFYACQREGIELVCPVDNNGQFTEEIPEYAGQFVKDADKAIAKRLKGMGRLVHQGTIRHRYPFCWRSDTPLIYKVVRTWFVAVETIKDKLLAANAQIHWTPEHIKDGRFGKWLEGARDWAISRNRYWGTPIPLWRSDDGDIHVVGSIDELQQLTGIPVDDLHRHFIDGLSFTKDGKTYKRIPEVFDCWFESGSMPYAQNHYPFENEEIFKERFPADFIAEGLDQTRGWFYTLTILAAALFDKPAFKNVIVNGIILASDGSKMSKRLKNYPDPMEVVHKYGADAIRLYMMHSPAVRGDDLCFKEAGVELVLRQILIPFWNAYSFLVTYARIYEWKPDDRLEEPKEPKPDAVIDRWILSLLNKLMKDVEEGMDNYDLSRAVEPFVGFVDQLTNWYIRRSRRRFWDERKTPDRDQAFQTLYHVLLQLCKIAAPFVPFITEAIYVNLRNNAMPDSVHLCRFPSCNDASRDQDLEEAMAAVQTVVSLGHALRKENKLKVRQPLASVHVVTADDKLMGFLKNQQHLISEELNIKEVLFESDEARFVTLKAKPNYRTLGRKVGKLMRGVQEAVGNFDQNQLQTLFNGESLGIEVEGETIVLTPEDVEVDRSVQEGMIAANSGPITIVLNTELNDDLLLEGLAREVVNKLNTMRRDGGYEVTDRIDVTLETTDKVRECFEVHGNYIRKEALALSVNFSSCEGQAWDLNGEPAKIAITKAITR
ncbi:MAG: isoleucine--tRNA ligase [Chlamydiia bacterium]|nr:isoleucine--tRNA ligase [Chlamydiia bacterium]